MASRDLAAQAEELHSLMPKVMRQLFTLDTHDPTAELPLAQLRACTVLCDGSRTISGLARELGVSVSAATQIADRLQSAGSVERVAGLEDRRLKNVRLTGHGAQMMRARTRKRVRRAAAALAQLTRDEREEVLQSLRQLLEAGGPALGAPALADPPSL